MLDDERDTPAAEPNDASQDDVGGGDAFDLFDLGDAPDADSAGSEISDEIALAAAERQEREEAEKDRARRELKEINEREEEAQRQRRQNVRVNVQYPLTVKVDGHPGVEIRTRDLSATGTGFATRIPLDVESEGVLTIEFPGWTFTKEFVVRFVKPILAGRQVGVQFISLTSDERERVVKEVFDVQRRQIQGQKQAIS